MGKLQDGRSLTDSAENANINSKDVISSCFKRGIIMEKISNNVLIKIAASTLKYALIAFMTVPLASYGAVSSVSSNAISLDREDWSSVTVVSETPLPSFSSMKLGTVIIIR
jgi:hypothetical protein